MKNICLVANYHLTYFFHEIAQELYNKYNIDISWVIVNEKNYTFLKKFYPSDRLLYIPIGSVLETKGVSIGEYKLNELIYGDRMLKYHYELGFDFLTKIQEIFFDFIKENKINYVFGELTWAHELLMCRLLKDKKELNCKYLSPFLVRIPNGRFAFFEDEFQNEIFITDYNYKDKEYPQNIFVPKKPDYLTLNNQILKKNNSIFGRLKRMWSFFNGQNLDKNDITLPRSGSLIRTLLPIQNEINKETYKLIPMVNIEFLTNKKFVLVTLHKQPEATIDVFGRYVEDQRVNILNLWRQLPNDWFLVVKEHSNAVGDRSYKFYKELLKYKNLVFIDEKTDSYHLLELCQAVFTVSGTIAYEAAMKGIKAFVFSDIFFSKFSFIKKINIYEDFRDCKNLDELLSKVPYDVTNDEDLKKRIYFNSYDGIISNPVSNSECMSNDNIIKVAEIFNMVIS